MIKDLGNVTSIAKKIKKKIIKRKGEVSRKLFFIVEQEI